MIIVLSAALVLANTAITQAAAPVVVQKNVTNIAMRMLREIGNTSLLISKTKLAIGAVTTAIMAGTAAYVANKPAQKPTMVDKATQTEANQEEAKKDKEDKSADDAQTKQITALLKTSAVLTQRNGMLQQERDAALAALAAAQKAAESVTPAPVVQQKPIQFPTVNVPQFLPNNKPILEIIDEVVPKRRALPETLKPAEANIVANALAAANTNGGTFDDKHNN